MRHKELRSFTRRQVLAATLAGGCVPLVMPAAGGIVTDIHGLDAGEVKIPTADGGTIPAYRVLPQRGAPFACLLLVHEIFGLTEHIRDLCRRLAKEGYFAVAPYFFSRETDVRIPNLEQRRELLTTVADAQVISDLDSTAKWAKGTGKADMSRLGVVGFGFGGRIAWLYAAHASPSRTSIAWYGHFKKPVSSARPRNPLDVVSEIQVPVLGLYGEADGGIPVGDVEEMRSALKQAGKDKDVEISVYPGAHHSFDNDAEQSSYNPQAAKAAWQSMLDWLREHGVAAKK